MYEYLKVNDPTFKLPVKKVEKPEQIEDKDTLTKLKSNLQQRIYDWKKKGKDASELIQEYNRVSKKLKEMK